MRWKLVLICVLLLSLSALQALADVAAIRAAALPQETAILAALDDVRQLEPYSSAWAPQWKYAIPKSDVANRLERDLALLNSALKVHPDNAELLLLSGLVAHYAYNVDVPETHDTALRAFDQARTLAPADIRATWFRASLLCQTSETKLGADQFLAIEASHVWDQLPAAFWDDYMACATLTNMPAHVLRAAAYLDKLHAPESPMQSSLVDIAQKHFNAFEPEKKYQPKDVWQGRSTGSDTEFTSTMCGVRFDAHGDWSVNQIGFSNASCVAYFSTGPYKAVTSNLRPSILVLVQRPAQNETLQDYMKKYLKDGTFEPFAPSRCPSAVCLSMKGVQPQMYKANGDGHGRILVFERDQPEFPGLLFESPSELPKQDPATTGPHAYHPSQTQQRIPGKLYYLILLDTAASIEEPATKDFDFFLQNLTVE